jgi:hypothetical protein
MRQLKKLILFIAFIFVKDVYGANFEKVDSLNQIIKNANFDAYSKGEAYLYLAEALYAIQLDTLKILSEKAIEQYQKAILENKNNEQKLLECYAGIAVGYNNIAVYWSVVSSPEKSLEWFDESLKWYEKAKDSINIAQTLNNLGAMYNYMGNFQKAATLIYKALTIFEKQNIFQGQTSALNMLGVLHVSLGETEMALNYYQKSLELSKQLNDEEAISLAMENIAKIYQSSSKLNEAESLLKSSIQLRKKFQNKNSLVSTYNNLVEFYLKIDDLKNVKLYLDSALYFLNFVESNKSIVATTKLNFAEYFVKVNDLKNASLYLTEVIQIATENKFNSSLKTAHFMMYDVSKKNKNFEASLVHYEQYISLRDSLNNEQNQKTLIRKQTQYEFEKEQLIKQQQQQEQERIEQEEKERRDNIQYSLIFLGILLVFGSILGLGFIKVSPKFAEGLIFFAFLIFFEFCLVLLDPIIEDWSGGEPIYKLLFNALLAGAIFPLHAFFEDKIKTKFISKY